MPRNLIYLRKLEEIKKELLYVCGDESELAAIIISLNDGIRKSLKKAVKQKRAERIKQKILEKEIGQLIENCNAKEDLEVNVFEMLVILTKIIDLEFLANHIKGI